MLAVMGMMAVVCAGGSEYCFMDGGVRLMAAVVVVMKAVVLMW